jgi:hypothetical protein
MRNGSMGTAVMDRPKKPSGKTASGQRRFAPTPEQRQRYQDQMIKLMEDSGKDAASLELLVIRITNRSRVKAKLPWKEYTEIASFVPPGDEWDELRIAMKKLAGY